MPEQLLLQVVSQPSHIVWHPAIQKASAKALVWQDPEQPFEHFDPEQPLRHPPEQLRLQLVPQELEPYYVDKKIMSSAIGAHSLLA